MALPNYLDPPNPDALMSENYLVLDFETTSLEKGSALNPDNRMLMAAWYYNGEYHAHWGDEYSQAKLSRHYHQCDLVVAQNFKFEAHWLNRMGIEYASKLSFDTMLADYVFAGNRSLPLNLDAIAKRWGVKGKSSVVSKMMKAGIPIEQIPREWVSQYCIQDVKTTHEIFLKQRRKLKSTGLLNVAFTRNILTPVLASIESQGLQLDCKKVISEHDRITEELAEVENELNMMVGAEVNLSSPQQLAKVLYEDFKIPELKKFGKPQRNKPSKAFPDGAPKTDMKTIQELKCSNKRQRRLQELLIAQSKLSAALSKALTLFKALCEQKGGLFYGEFNQARTATHRLSASGRKRDLIIDGEHTDRAAQIQNIDRTHKKLFMAREGRLCVESDFAGLELRVAGILGNDDAIRDDVLAGVDVHANCRDVLNSAGMSIDRTGAKQYSFKPQYSILQHKDKPTPADEYATWYKERYNQLASEQMSWVNLALRDKKVKTKWGLIYYFPNCRLSSSGYTEDGNKVLNYPIQGFGGAEIMGSALTYLYHRTKNIDGITLVNTIHDSVIAEVKPELMVEYSRLVAQSMLDDAYDYCRQVYGIEMTTPLGIGISAGTHWSSKEGLQPEDYCAIIDTLKQNGYNRAVLDGHEIKIDFYIQQEK